jgi:hypothetical protein
MVMKMNEPTVTECHSEAVPSNTTVVIHLNPQPTKDTVCDNSSAITTATGETTLSDMLPSDYDTESLQNTQMMVKKSLKLELTHNNNEIKSLDSGSPPENEEDLSFKSPSSPRTCKNLMKNLSLEYSKHFCLIIDEERLDSKLSQLSRSTDSKQIRACLSTNIFNSSFFISSPKPFRSPSNIRHVSSRSCRRSKTIA